LKKGCYTTGIGIAVITVMKRLFILAFAASVALAGCKATAHGGNCGCPKFGQEKPQGENGSVSASAEAPSIRQ
jgi:hypothetical protein